MTQKRDPRAFLETLKRSRQEHPWRWWWGQKLAALRTTFTSLLRSCVTSLWGFTLGRWLFVKPYEPGKHFAAMLEVENLRFIRTHTTIPVPRPLFTVSRPLWFERMGAVVVMTRARGVPLEEAWQSLPRETRASVIHQLAAHLAQLRSLRSPYGDAVCSVSGGPFYCVRTNGMQPRGPFASEAELNACLRGRFSLSELHPSVAESHARSHPPITFTHGDLLPRNILYDDGKITAIVDWENAGWFPAHWEYLKTRFGLTDLAEEWSSWMSQYMDAYPEEAVADAHLFSVEWRIMG